MGQILSQKLNIAIISPPWFPVPPAGYGGIEAVVHLLTEGLVKHGHNVTLFASGDSTTSAQLEYVFETATYALMGENVFIENDHSLNAYRRAREFDIIHDHDGMSSRVMGATTRALLNIPVVATMHGPADPASLNFYNSIKSEMFYIAISEYQRRSFEGLDFLATIHNALKLEEYTFNPAPDDYLLFVGRMSHEKGAHVAVEVAKRLGRKLILVGKCNERAEIKYFDTMVKPNMGANTEYIGEVDAEHKVELYSNAECVLFPIQWPEPFGLVMIEAMACGTPVVALRNGSVPEVIKDGLTGFIVDNDEDIDAAVGRISSIERSVCRETVEQEYNQNIFIERHLQAYRKAIAALG